MDREFGKLIYAIVKPPARITSTSRICSDEEYDLLRKEARRHKSYLYYAELIEKDGKPDVKQPWKLDPDSVYCREAELASYKRPPRPHRDDSEEVIEEQINTEPLISEETQEAPKESLQEPNPLQCPYCSKVATSTPGRTLHIKSKHPDKYEEYKKNQ